MEGLKMKRKSMDILNTIINAKVGGNYIEITYNNGKGHFKIVKSAIFNYTISDFRKLVDIIKLSNDCNLPFDLTMLKYSIPDISTKEILKSIGL